MGPGAQVETPPGAEFHENLAKFRVFTFEPGPGAPGGSSPGPNFGPGTPSGTPRWPSGTPGRPPGTPGTPSETPLKREIVGFSRKCPFWGGLQGPSHRPRDPLWDPPTGPWDPPVGPPYRPWDPPTGPCGTPLQALGPPSRGPGTPCGTPLQALGPPSRGPGTPCGTPLWGQFPPLGTPQNGKSWGFPGNGHFGGVWRGVPWPGGGLSRRYEAPQTAPLGSRIYRGLQYVYRGLEGLKV